VKVDGFLIGQVTELVVRVQPGALRLVVPGV
jgi:diacylglycerol kinase family enzyme